jgi:hypothetical protein
MSSGLREIFRQIREDIWLAVAAWLSGALRNIQERTSGIRKMDTTLAPRPARLNPSKSGRTRDSINRDINKYRIL